jgi:hypothetical protein
VTSIGIMVVDLFDSDHAKGKEKDSGAEGILMDALFIGLARDGISYPNNMLER